MSQIDTDGARPRAALPVRRPPAPRHPLATVTRLTTTRGLTEDVPVAHVQGTLALDLGGLPHAPATPELRVVETRGEPGEADLHTWAARFAQATVEVLGGQRPLAQLVRWTSAPVYADLQRRVRILSQTPPLPAQGRAVRPQVRSVHVFQPERGAAEVSIHVRHGHRSRAIAARLEEGGGRWRCVILQLG